MATKKVGSSGRFGVRYGKKIRKKIAEIETKQKRKHKCPYCSKFKVQRVSAGIWECKGCNAKFSGRAYEV